MERITNRKKQALETRQRITKAAQQLIREYGYDSVTVEDICKASGVSVGAFYHHLRNKAGIILESAEECSVYFEKPGGNSNTSAYESIVEFARLQIQYAVNNIGLKLMVQTFKSQLSDSRAYLFAEDRDYARGLFKVIKTAQDKGELDNTVEYTRIGTELLILIRGILYNWCHSGGNYDVKPLAERMVRNYLSTYKKPMENDA